MYNPQEISNRIKNIAKSKNIVLKNMLSDCDLGINLISHLAKGQAITYINLAKIADYLDCSVDYLLGREETSHSINQVNTGNVGDNSNVNINKPVSSSDEKDEMTTELIKVFNTLPFCEKLDILNFVMKKRKDIF